ncbi:MAG: hypothetical protein Q9163_001295 [Psora crenata]
MQSTFYLILSSLAYLVSSSPISSPLEHGGLDRVSREYMTSAAGKASLLDKLPDKSACNKFNMDNVTMNYGALPPPTPGLKLYHVALGRGTQNYTCETATSPSAAPVALGAVADLYNVTCTTCFLGNDITNRFTNIIARQKDYSNMAQSLTRSGHHYFSDNTTATFNLHTDIANYGISFSKKTANVSAPADATRGEDGSAAVPWLKLKVELPPVAPLSLNAEDSASHVAEIYRLNTAGGAQSTCEGYVGQRFQKQYAAEYWFWN